MNPIVFFIQSVGVAVFIVMLELFLVPQISRKQRFLLYFYVTFCSVFLTIYTGNAGTPALLAGSFLILLFTPAKVRLWNIILFQLVWFWSVLTDYAITIPMRFFGYDFDRIRSCLPAASLFLLIHAVIAIVPCALLRKRLHRALRIYGEGFPSSMQWLLLGEISLCSGIYLFNIVAGSLWTSVVARMNTACSGGSSRVFSNALNAEAESICTSSTM